MTAKQIQKRLDALPIPSLVSLQAAINRCIEHHNHEPSPFAWKAAPKNSIAAAKRGHQTLQTIHYVTDRARPTGRADTDSHGRMDPQKDLSTPLD